MELRPETFQKNAFRLLGLPSDARLKLIKRRAATLVSLINGDEVDEVETYVIGGFTDPPDEPEIRASSHRLEDPEKRLADEIFWFRDDPDAAAGSVKSETLGAQVDHWLESEALDDAGADLATHNLAIYFHLIASQIEFAIAKDIQPKDDLLEAYHADAAAAWREVFVRRRKLARSEAYQGWLEGRFETVVGSRLESDALEEVKTLAHNGAISHLIQLAYDMGRQGRLEETERLRDLSRKNGVSKKDFAAAAERHLHGPAEQMLSAADTAQQTIDKDAETAGQKAAELMDQLLPDLEAMQRLLGEDHHLIASLGDAIATAVNRAQLVVSEKQKDHDTSRALLERVMPFVRSPELTPVLKNNLAHMTCQFCLKRTRDDACGVPYVVSRVSSYNSLSESFNVERVTIDVPRCTDCHARGSDRRDRARDFHAVQERLEKGWLDKAEPEEADLLAFLRWNT